MAEQIPLITSADGFEVARNALVNILAIELADQQAQAEALSIDPDPWKMKVFAERVNPFESMRDAEGYVQPIINVWYETSTLSERESNPASSVMQSRYNIDVYGYGVAYETATGHVSGDEAAIVESQRASRIVRQILMHPKYLTLGLARSVVGWRKLTTRRGYKPNGENGPAENVMGINLEMLVSHAETVPFETLSDSEGALVTIKYDADGAVVAQLNYDWTSL